MVITLTQFHCDLFFSSFGVIFNSMKLAVTFQVYRYMFGASSELKQLDNYLVECEVDFGTLARSASPGEPTFKCASSG